MEDIKVIDAYLQRLVDAGITEIAIYPYGNIGRTIKKLLNEKYHIQESALYDRKENRDLNILSPELIEESSDCYYLVGTKDCRVLNEVVSSLLRRGVHDTKILKPFKLNWEFCDDDRSVWSRQQKEACEARYQSYRVLAERARHDRGADRQKKRGPRRNPGLIVSLTSFPARIHIAHQAVESILRQSLKPDKIILWLAAEEFPKRERELPESLLSLVSDRFEIAWCENLRSYKKLVPALERCPEDIIVTADDDLLYDSDWLKILYDSYLRYPEDIHCHRVTKIIRESDGIWRTLPGGWDYYSGACPLNKLSGGSGTLYPPGVLHQDALLREVFMEIAPTSDDIWFWLMGLLNGRSVRAAVNNKPGLRVSPGAAETPALSASNDSGEKLFWVHFHNIINTYPVLKEILDREVENRRLPFE